MQARPKYPPAKRPITPTAAPENENPKKAIKRVETVMHENPKPSAAPSHCSSGPHHDEGAASNPAVWKRVPRSSFLCLLFLAKAIKRKGGIARFRVLPFVSLLSFDEGFLVFHFLKIFKREAMRDFNPFPFGSYLLVSKENRKCGIKRVPCFSFLSLPFPSKGEEEQD